MKAFCFPVLMICVAGCSGCNPPRVAESRARVAGADFGGFDGCFVMYDASRKNFMRIHPERCAERLSPCSTFKIPNALIGVETGVVSGPDHLLRWDGVRHDREALNHDHTLRTAIRDSVVWYFQRVAAGVGEERMRRWLADIDYGDQDMSSGLTQFWLGNSLRISADEQVRFLCRFRDGELPISSRTAEIVKKCLVDREFATRRVGRGVLRGKTGSMMEGNKPVLGWYVGWLEHGADAYVFAMNIKGEGATGLRARPLAIALLESMVSREAVADAGEPAARGDGKQ